MADIARVLDRVSRKRGQKGQTIESRPSLFVMTSTSNISKSDISYGKRYNWRFSSWKKT